MTQATQRVLPVGDPAARAGAAPAAATLARRSGPRRPFTSSLLLYAVLVLGAILLLVPLVWLVSGSLKTDAQVANIGQIIPARPQRDNYPQAMERMGLRLSTTFPYMRFPALANTVVITTLCMIGQVVSTSLVGYGFARYRFRGRDTVFIIMLSTMMLPARVTMIPLFLLFRSLGWIDTLLPLIVPVFFSAPFFIMGPLKNSWCGLPACISDPAGRMPAPQSRFFRGPIFMFRQFFSQVPEELLEAARIDGAGHLQIYARIMLPLSLPVIAIVAIYTFMHTWNDFLGPLIYLNRPEMRTLALELNLFSGQYGVQDRNLLMAASFVTMLPCILLFFVAQRYFVQSEAGSGLKG